MEIGTSSKAALISKNLPKRFKLHTSLRSFIFFILFLSIIASNLTKGIFISSTQIKISLELSEIIYGLFPSLFNVGRVLGTLLLMYLINKVHRKWLVVFSILITAFFVSLFKLTTNMYILLVVYCLTGMANMATTIYIPIWIDQFAMTRYKSIFLTLIQFGEALGMAFGFLLNYIIGDENYQWQFIIESGLLVIFAGILSLISELYFSARVLILKEVNGTEQVNIKEDVNDNYRDHHQSVTSLFRIRQSNESTFELDFTSKMKVIASTPLFIFALLSCMVILTTQTTVNYWIIDYIKLIYKIEDDKKALITYVIIALSGPIGGILASTILSMTMGNYNHRYAPIIMVIIYVLATVVSNQIPYIDNSQLFVTLIIVFLLFCSTTLPMVQGICLSSISQSLKGTAFSFANMIINIFGVIPSTYIYGYLHNSFKSTDPKFAMNCFMKYMCVGAFFSLVTLILKCRSNKIVKEVFRGSIEMRRESEIKSTSELQDKKTEEKLDDSHSQSGKGSHREGTSEIN